MSSTEMEETVKQSISEAIREHRASTMGWKRGLVCDFENFNFLHLEIRRTREKHSPVQSGVVRVNGAKAESPTVRVCIAVIANTNVMKVGGPFGPTIDCLVLLFGLQRKSPRRVVARILQHEKETLQTRISFHLPGCD
jgi:hypothetical protein